SLQTSPWPSPPPEKIAADRQAVYRRIGKTRRRRSSFFRSELRGWYGASDAAVPLVAAVGPEAAVAAAKPGERVDRVDLHDVLRLLVAKLTLDAETDRRAVRDGQGFAIQLVGEDRLRVEGILEAVALVIAAGAI